MSGGRLFRAACSAATGCCAAGLLEAVAPFTTGVTCRLVYAPLDLISGLLGARAGHHHRLAWEVELTVIGILVAASMNWVTSSLRLQGGDPLSRRLAHVLAFGAPWCVSARALMPLLAGEPIWIPVTVVAMVGTYVGSNLAWSPGVRLWTVGGLAVAVLYLGAVAVPRMSRFAMLALAIALVSSSIALAIARLHRTSATTAPSARE